MRCRAPPPGGAVGSPLGKRCGGLPERLLVRHGEAELVFVARQRRSVKLALLLHFQQGVGFAVLSGGGGNEVSASADTHQRHRIPVSGRDSRDSKTSHDKLNELRMNESV